MTPVWGGDKGTSDETDGIIHQSALYPPPPGPLCQWARAMILTSEWGGGGCLVFPGEGGGVHWHTRTGQRPEIPSMSY